jgi:hypothetical protein
MGDVEVVISPVVSSTAELVELIDPTQSDAAPQDLTSMRFRVGGGDRYWSDEVTVSYRPFRLGD